MVLVEIPFNIINLKIFSKYLKINKDLYFKFISRFQASRRSSVEFSHADPGHMVDDDINFKNKLKRINEMDDDEPNDLELSGEATLDAAIVSRWIAKSYGQTSRAYHEAYNRE